MICFHKCSKPFTFIPCTGPSPGGVAAHGLTLSFFTHSPDCAARGCLIAIGGSARCSSGGGGGGVGTTDEAKVLKKVWMWNLSDNRKWVEVVGPRAYPHHLKQHCMLLDYLLAGSTLCLLLEEGTFYQSSRHSAQRVCAARIAEARCHQH